MWRMENAVVVNGTPQDPWLGRSAGTKSLVFHRVLRFRAWSQGCRRIPELVFALQSLLLWSSYVLGARGAQESPCDLFP